MSFGIPLQAFNLFIFMACARELMIDHNIGVSTSRSFEIKKIDLDYFTEE